MAPSARPDDQEQRGTVDLPTATATNASVEAFLAHRGVPERDQAAHLAQVLRLSTMAISRRRTAKVDWSVSELQRIAQRHGGRLSLQLETDLVQEATGIDGEFVMGDRMLPCRFVHEGPATIGSRIIAVEVAGRWLVGPTGQVPLSPATPLHVTSFQVQCPSAAPRVAILDDDKATADAIRNVFAKLGHDAESFYSAKELHDALYTDTAFDAYILDWQLGRRETSQALCEQLRATHPSALMILLTGQLSGNANREADFLALSKTLDVSAHEKPERATLLVAEVERHVASVRRLAGQTVPVP